ncbi:MAG: hypothetical protein ACOCWK_07690 [Tangfeifania sp.]
MNNDWRYSLNNRWDENRGYEMKEWNAYIFKFNGSAVGAGGYVLA